MLMLAVVSGAPHASYWGYKLAIGPCIPVFPLSLTLPSGLSDRVACMMMGLRDILDVQNKGWPGASGRLSRPEKATIPKAWWRGLRRSSIAP